MLPVSIGSRAIAQENWPSYAPAWTVWKPGSIRLASAPSGVFEATLGKAVTSQPAGLSDGTTASVAATSATAPAASGSGTTRLVSERTIDLSILMPVYDERATVERAIAAV